MTRKRFLTALLVRLAPPPRTSRSTARGIVVEAREGAAPPSGAEAHAAAAASRGCRSSGRDRDRSGDDGNGDGDCGDGGGGRREREE